MVDRIQNASLCHCFMDRLLCFSLDKAIAFLRYSIDQNVAHFYCPRIDSIHHCLRFPILSFQIHPAISQPISWCSLCYSSSYTPRYLLGHRIRDRLHLCPLRIRQLLSNWDIATPRMVSCITARNRKSTSLDECPLCRTDFWKRGSRIWMERMASWSETLRDA